MRDSKRIDILLDYIRKEWKENPDLRLSQLMGNIIWEASKYQQKHDPASHLARNAPMVNWGYSMEDEFLIEAYRKKYPATGMLDIENKKELKD